MKWALKISAKILLSRLPIDYRFWKSAGLFKHGKMDTSGYSLKIFNMHSDRAFPSGIPDNATILEMGPGDSAASAVIAATKKVGKTILVDVGDYATKDVGFYKSLAAELDNAELKNNLDQVDNFGDLLKACCGEYHCDGLESLRKLPDESVDFSWSHSVLEHVRAHQFVDTFKELYRITKPGGVSSHNIDFQDHFQYSLNNLRFSKKVWESDLFVNSGFYTNRIPAVDMHRMFRDAGFKVLKEGFGRWPELPLAKSKMHSDFHKYTDDELRCRTSHVLLHKK